MFWDVLSAFTCVSVICDLWSICLGVNVLRFEWLETLSWIDKPEKPVPSTFIGNILLSKASTTLSLPLKSAYTFLTISFFVWIMQGFFF